MMRCPRCIEIELRKVKVKSTGAIIDRRPKCDGIWFDRRELEGVLPEAVKDFTVPFGAKQSAFHFCPHCATALFQFNYPGTYVNVDMCKKCLGLWVDAGEFKEIKAVRRALEKRGGAREKDSDPAGLKGGLINFINSAIDQLLDS